MGRYSVLGFVFGGALFWTGCQPPLPLGQWAEDSGEFIAYDVQSDAAVRLVRPAPDEDEQAWKLEPLHDPHDADPAIQYARTLFQSKACAGFAVDGQLRRYAIVVVRTNEGVSTLEVTIGDFGQTPLLEPDRHVLPAEWGCARWGAWAAICVDWTPGGERLLISGPPVVCEHPDLPWNPTLAYDVRGKGLTVLPNVMPVGRFPTIPWFTGPDQPCSPVAAMRPDGEGFLGVRLHDRLAVPVPVFVHFDGRIRDLEVTDDEEEGGRAEKLRALTRYSVVDSFVIWLRQASLVDEETWKEALFSARPPEIQWEGNVAYVTTRSIVPEFDRSLAMRIDTEAAVVRRHMPEATDEASPHPDAMWEYEFPTTGVKLRAVRHDGVYVKTYVVQPDGARSPLGPDVKWNDAILYPSPDGKTAIFFAGTHSPSGGLLSTAPRGFARRASLIVARDGTLHPIGERSASD